MSLLVTLFLLSALTIQNVLFIHLIKGIGKNFLISIEIAKISLTYLCLRFEGAQENVNKKVLFLIGIPAILYAIQGSLNWKAIHGLDPLTFQLLLQTKIPISAIFSIIKGQKQRKERFIFLFVIMAGLLLFQKSQIASQKIHSIIMVVVGSFLSTLAGHILENIVRGIGINPLRVSNQLAIWSLFILSSSSSLSTVPFDVPENGKEFLTIIVGASGGIIVGICMKYSTTVERSISGAISLCINAIIKSGKDGGTMDFRMIFGVLMVAIGGVGYVLK